MFSTFGKKKKTAILEVEGMACSHCAAKVKNALLKEKGVSDVTVDLAQKKVTVVGSDFDTAALAEVVNSVGFKAVRTEEAGEKR